MTIINNISSINSNANSNNKPIILEKNIQCSSNNQDINKNSIRKYDVCTPTQNQNLYSQLIPDRNQLPYDCSIC